MHVTCLSFAWNEGRCHSDFGDPRVLAGLWLAGDEGMEKRTETTIMGYIGITIRIHSFIPSQPKASWSLVPSFSSLREPRREV